MSEQIIEKLRADGTEAKLVSIAALAKVREAYEELDHSAPVWNEFLSALILNVPAGMEAARSILILADPSYAVRVTFSVNGQEKSFLVPPTYIYKRQRQHTKELVESILAECGHNAWKVYLPCKRLGVLSGLTKYGRNNVTYTSSHGSYVFMQAFITTLETDNEPQEVNTAERCAACNRCLNACPTGAISDNEFLIDAGRCVTFYNELEGPFPEWIKGAHNCVVGCMRCQLCCPMNEGKLMTKEGPSFDERETQMILSGAPFEELSGETAKKIEEIEQDGSYNNFVRNIRALLEK